MSSAPHRQPQNILLCASRACARPPEPCGTRLTAVTCVRSQMTRLSSSSNEQGGHRSPQTDEPASRRRRRPPPPLRCCWLIRAVSRLFVRRRRLRRRRCGGGGGRCGHKQGGGGSKAGDAAGAGAACTWRAAVPGRVLVLSGRPHCGPQRRRGCVRFSRGSCVCPFSP